MTFEEFMVKAEASPFTWEIFGYANDLIFDGVDSNIAYAEALEYGIQLELDVLKWEKEYEIK
jgi:hypothetical protein